MADNVPITAGSGTNIATDEVGGVHYQQVKLALGALDAVDNVVDAGQQTMSASVPVVLASDHTDVKVTLDSETVAIASIAAGDNNIGNVDVLTIAAGDNNIGNVDVVTMPSDTFAADASAYGKGVLMQGDDGTDRRAVLVDTTGHVQVDVQSQPLLTSSDVVTVNGGAGQTSDIKVTLDSEAVVLGAGAASIGTLGANSGVDIGDVDVASLPAPLNVSGSGTEATALRVTIATDSTGVLSVDDNGNALTVDQATAASLKCEPAGNVAHDGSDSGNPLKIGGRADTTFQAAVADGDRVDALFDVYGQLRVRRDHCNNWSFHSDGSSALTDEVVQAAPGSGLSSYITDIIFSTGAATACNLFFEEGSTKILGPYYLEATAGRGLVLHFQTPKKVTANTAVTVTTSAAIAQSLDVLGFIAP